VSFREVIEKKLFHRAKFSACPLQVNQMLKLQPFSSESTQFIVFLG